MNPKSLHSSTEQRSSRKQPVSEKPPGAKETLAEQPNRTHRTLGVPGKHAQITNVQNVEN